MHGETIAHERGTMPTLQEGGEKSGPPSNQNFCIHDLAGYEAIPPRPKVLCKVQWAMDRILMRAPCLTHRMQRAVQRSPLEHRISGEANQVI